MPAPLPWSLPARLPAHVLNGLSVALGIALIHLAALPLDAHAAMWVTSGAIFASLADQPVALGRVWRRVVAAGLAGCAATATVALLAGHPFWLGLGIAGLALAASLTLAWGPKAGAVSFAPLLAIVFTMALPPGQPLGALLGWHLAGSAAYLLWLVVSASALQRRYRTLSVASTLQHAARLLRLRAAMLRHAGDPSGDTRRLQDWVREEAALAERLQAARDLLFTGPDTPRIRRESALLLRTIDLRDILLASLLEFDLMGRDEAGRRLRDWLATGLDELADGLAQQEARLRSAAHLRGGSEACDAVPAPTGESDEALIARLRAFLPPSASAERHALVPALVHRLRRLQGEVGQLQALTHGSDDTLPLSREQLRGFAAPESWSLATLRSHLTLRSPVMRHALRYTLALACAYYVARLLPWTSHPQWMVISVAVVLRGNLAQTLARRNLRLLGTALGCLLVVGLVALESPHLLTVAFLAAAGFAHGFVMESYLVTATAATLMSLLQVHLTAPGLPLPVLERLGDTVLGAAIAWAFSFVLPSWERRSLPSTVTQALDALRDYAALAVGPADDAVAQRLARRRAYDALLTVGAALERTSAEPAGVRPPIAALAAFVDQGQRLMAHLSMIRLMRLRQATGGSLPAGHPPGPVAAALAESLTLEGAGREAAAPPPDGIPPPPTTLDLEPWLGWRLDVAVLTGRRTGLAARNVLEALDARSMSRPRAASG